MDYVNGCHSWGSACRNEGTALKPLERPQVAEDVSDAVFVDLNVDIINHCPLFDMKETSQYIDELSHCSLVLVNVLED